MPRIFLWSGAKLCTRWWAHMAPSTAAEPTAGDHSAEFSGLVVSGPADADGMGSAADGVRSVVPGSDATSSGGAVSAPIRWANGMVVETQAPLSA